MLLVFRRTPSLTHRPVAQTPAARLHDLVVHHTLRGGAVSRRRLSGLGCHVAFGGSAGPGARRPRERYDCRGAGRWRHGGLSPCSEPHRLPSHQCLPPLLQHPLPPPRKTKEMTAGRLDSGRTVSLVPPVSPAPTFSPSSSQDQRDCRQHEAAAAASLWCGRSASTVYAAIIDYHRW